MTEDVPEALHRYSRQIRLPEVGVEGQKRLLDARVVIIGVGALGTALASGVVRAGVGFVRLVDRDYIEEHNLQRQALFDEDDIAADLPKAVAAAEKLRRVNHQVTIEPVVVDVNAGNIEALIADCDLVLDGGDNFEIRMLVNDACLKHRRPWVYGAAIGMHGMTAPFTPGAGPCFRCMVSDLPAPGTVDTCDMVGVLGTVPQVIAALQVTEALKLLTGQVDDLCRDLRIFDAWRGTLEQLGFAGQVEDCPACGEGRLEFLEGRQGTDGTVLCGRDAVQVKPRGLQLPDFPALGARLAPLGDIVHNEYLLRFRTEECELTLFRDGRAIIKGTADPSVARSLYARYVGG
jgi:molybdopterin-synthase adenylyltransferase